MLPLRNLLFRVAPLVLLTSLLGGCGSYRLIRADEIEIPNYEPRPVAIPQECEPLIQRAADNRMVGFTETEVRMVAFCQQQQIVRAQEEEAVAKRIEAHAEVANFVLRAVVVTAGAVIGVLTWLVS